jgi:hypothetical protein
MQNALFSSFLFLMLFINQIVLGFSEGFICGTYHFSNISDCRVSDLYQDQAGPIIQFTDGTEWLIVDSEEDLKEVFAQWQIGDEIHLCPYYDLQKKGTFALQNLGNGTFLFASLNALPRLKEIPLRIVSINFDSTKITLNDGSFWVFQETLDWKLGDRIVIYKGFFYGDYLLMNANQENWSFGELTF